MPYIKNEKRVELILRNSSPENAGELNFLFTNIIDGFIHNKGLSYATLNEAIGALECAKLELYRRMAAPYEDKKSRENGDVFTTSI